MLSDLQSQLPVWVPIRSHSRRADNQLRPFGHLYSTLMGSDHGELVVDAVPARELVSDMVDVSADGRDLRAFFLDRLLVSRSELCPGEMSDAEKELLA